MSKNDGFKFCRSIDRRSFLKYCAAVGGGLVAGGVAQSTFDVLRIGSRSFKVSDTRLRMGTYVTMTAVHESRSLAEEAIGHAFEEMDRLIAIFSRHDPTTPLSGLNARGVLLGPPPELAHVINRSIEFSAQSGGAFDVTVGPLVELYRLASESDRTPDDSEIGHAVSLVGANKLVVSADELRLARPSMSVTLDGVAKGYIVDCVSNALEARGIENHLVNAGGDIRARGYRNQGRPWNIAIEDPEKKGNYRDVIRLTNGAVATSGDYEIYYDDERVFHHVVDPRFGRSPRQSTSVSVIADSAMRADAYSTAVLVMEPEAGTQLINSLPASECLLIDHGGKKRETRHWTTFSVRQSA